MSKIGLIVEGGGMKCAYSAGILDAFIDDDVTFDYAIGASAGSANVASFIARQRGRNIRFYRDHVHDPRYLGFKNYLKTGNLFGLQYIYGDLTNSNGKDPLDLPAIMANPTEFKIVCTNASTGKPAYFDKKSLIQDKYVHIMASCALPAACKPIKIKNQYYYDGGVSDSIPIKKALHDGCDKVVIILSKPRDFVKKPEGMKLFYTLACRKFPNTIKALNRRHIMYKHTQDLMFKLEKEGRAFIFAPSHPPKMGTFTKDSKTMQALYQLGFEDYGKARFELEKFMRK